MFGNKGYQNNVTGKKISFCKIIANTDFSLAKFYTPYIYIYIMYIALI